VPKSRVRQKKVYTPPTNMVPRAATASKRKPSPTWLPVTAVSLIVVGIAWLVTFYLSQGDFPVAAWRYWNLAIGFGAMVGALGLLARWR
jgi:hypothetical protein